MDQREALTRALEGVGARIALDLAEQAARPPREAAQAAGCSTENELEAWLLAHRRPPSVADGEA